MKLGPGLGLVRSEVEPRAPIAGRNVRAPLASGLVPPDVDSHLLPRRPVLLSDSCYQTTLMVALRIVKDHE